MSPSPSLDALLRRAREVDVRADVAAVRVAELERWARTPAPTRRWWPLAGAVAMAAVACLVAWRWWPAGSAPNETVVIGDRVAIAPEPGSRYQLAHADARSTEVIVERGAVTARLWPGATAHQLVLRGGGVRAVATGTIYTLAITPAGAQVRVHEGTVSVTSATGERVVAAGDGWPSDGVSTVGDAAATRLIALAAPPAVPASAPPPIDAAVADATARDASVDAPDAAVQPRPRPDAGPTPTPTPTPTQRWRTVRMLRAQNRIDDALAAALALADTRDPTWSAIALVEAIRIELGPKASPERAIELAARMAREWPQHVLRREARMLECRALTQLGRGAACAAPP